MPRNKTGGNKARKSKNSTEQTGNRELILKNRNEPGEQYGKIKKRLGGSPPCVEVDCEDNTARRCIIRGKLQKKVWMNPGDFVLILYNNDSSDLKGEISHVYNNSEVNKLFKLKELNPNKFGEQTLDEDDTIQFEATNYDDILRDSEEDEKETIVKPKTTVVSLELDSDDDDDDSIDIDDI